MSYILTELLRGSSFLFTNSSACRLHALVLIGIYPVIFFRLVSSGQVRAVEGATCWLGTIGPDTVGDPALGVLVRQTALLPALSMDNRETAAK